MLSATLVLALSVPGNPTPALAPVVLLGTQGGPITGPAQGSKKPGKPSGDKPPGGGYTGPGDWVPPNDGRGNGGGSHPEIPTPGDVTPARGAREPAAAGQTPITGNERERVRTGRESFEAYNDRFDIWWERNRFALVHFPPLHYGTSIQGRPDSLATDDEVVKLRLDATQRLKALLDHPQGRVRMAAAIGLGKLRATVALESLRALLEDPESSVRDAACLALGMLGDARADHLLLHYVMGTGGSGAPDAGALEYRRGVAAVALSMGGSATTPKLLLSLARNADLPAEVRAYVLAALGACGDSGYLPDVTPMTDDEGLPLWVRQGVFTCIGKLGAASAMPVLVKGLRSSHLDEARSAAIALGMSQVRGDATLTDVLEQVMTATDDVGLRNFATISLGRIGGPGAERALLRVLTRGRQQQVPWAAVALGLLCRSEPSPTIVDQLAQKLRASSNVEHRSALCLALGLTGMHEAEAALLGEVQSIQPRIQGFSAAGLGLLRSSAGSSALADIAIPAPGAGRVIAPAVADQIAFAWSLIDDESAYRGLLDLLESESRPEVRLAAARALGHLGRVDAVQRLRSSMDANQTDALRLSEAVIALGTLLGVERTPELSRVMANSNFVDEPPTVRELTTFLW